MLKKTKNNENVWQRSDRLHFQPHSDAQMCFDLERTKGTRNTLAFIGELVIFVRAAQLTSPWHREWPNTICLDLWNHPSGPPPEWHSDQSESSDCVVPLTHQQPVYALQEGTRAPFSWHRTFFFYSTCPANTPPPPAPYLALWPLQQEMCWKGAILKWDNVQRKMRARKDIICSWSVISVWVVSLGWNNEECRGYEGWGGVGLGGVD